MTELAIEMEFRTDVGRKRRHNEDFVDFHEPAGPEELARSGRLYIVADGVGGGAAGETASEYAAGKVLHEYYRATDLDLGERLRAAISAANADIFEHVEQRPELGRMGTTMVAAVVHGDRLVVANVGDSRAYLIRNGEIRQITRDHSLVAKLVEEGSITPEEAEHHPKRNVVLRSIGADLDVYPDVFEGRLQPGDQVVLCSDGLTRYVSNDEIMSVATRTRADRAVKQLVDMANVRGGKDNISVMLLRATEPVPLAVVAEMVTRRRMPVQPEFETIYDTAHKRRRVPPRPPRPQRVWLAVGGAVGALVLLAVLFIGGRALGIIPAFLSPINTPSPTTVLSVNEILPTLLSPSPTPKTTAAPTSTATHIPTPIPTLSPVPIPATDDPLGDVATYLTGTPITPTFAGLDIRSASVGTDLQIVLGSRDGLPEELLGWAQEGEAIFWIALHEPISNSLPVRTEWFFVLDLDGSEATGRQIDRPVNVDLGDEAAVVMRYSPQTENYDAYLLVWDPDENEFVRRANIRRWMSEDRTMVAMAVQLATLRQEVAQFTGVTMMRDAVRGRAAAIAFLRDAVADLCPD